MSRFRQEMKIVAPGVWVLAAITWVTIAAGVTYMVSKPGADTDGWPQWGKGLFIVGLPTIMFVYTILVGYVFSDAKRRGMRHVMWTLLVIFIPNAIGFIIYFLLRDPVPQGCRSCGAPVNPKFPYCPNCGAPRAQTCAQCHNAIEAGWAHCATCGAKI